MLKQAECIYEFGQFRLNIKAKLFLKESKPVPLNPKTFELLAVLVQRSGRLVEKEELLQELWPDSFVEESNLTQNVYLLRKALGEDAHGEVYIKTIPRHGYRFVAEVREVRDDLKDLVDQAQCDEAPAPAEEEKYELPRYAEPAPAIGLAPPVAGSSSGLRLRAGLIAGVILLSLAALSYLWLTERARQRETSSTIKSIAVLPFKTLGAESQDELLGLGMADAVIIKMSKLQQIPVLPTSSIIKYTGREHDPLAVGRELGVDAVLDGTVQRAGDRIRVTVQLISLRDGRTLWSDMYDEQFTNIFTVQDVISEHVARRLQPNLSNEERAQLAKRYTDNTEAYDAYLRAIYFWNKRTEDGLIRAIEYFQQAVEKDPKFALAYAGLADAYGLIGYFGYKLLTFEEAHEKARATATRALELDETIAEAHTAMALVKEIYEKEIAAAEQQHKRAIALNPNSAIAHHRYATFLVGQGRLDESFQETQRAHQLDPLSAVINFTLGYTFFLRGDYERAEEYGRKSGEIEPNYVQAQILLGLIDEEKGLYAEALTRLLGIKSSASGNIYPTVLDALGYTYAAMGRKDEAQKVLLELDQLAKQNEVAKFRKIPTLARLGRMKEAFKLLDWEVEDSTALPYWLKSDPRYESLRSDPAYPEFLRRHKFSE